MEFLHKNFEGINYRLANNWFSVLDIKEYENKPINYLEIGTFYGANIISVGNTYGKHPDSKLYCIDPWEDYSEYSEYKNQQNYIYNKFVRNIENYDYKNKITTMRGYSYNEIPKLENDFFDIIYIDGNHVADYVLEDAVLAFRKLKHGGILIFDDYGDDQPTNVKGAVDPFINIYYNKLKILNPFVDTQVFLQKL